MDPNELIDAQFEKAVSIVQSLPKTGPIQTGYEEKLAMYSLYKQATVGNVKAPRPGLWDMLGRAKWDAWAKHKDVAPNEAKWQYVETLLKVLRKYSDKTVARDLVRELESYGDLGGSFSHLSYRQTSPSGSSGSESAAAANRAAGRTPKVDYNNASEDDTTDDDAGDLAAEGGEISEDDRDEHRPLPGAASQGEPGYRPPSSLSSHRYRTPMAGSTFSPAPPIVPATQPMPGFTTPSAFGGSASPAAVPSSATASTFMIAGSYPPSSAYPPHLAHTPVSPRNIDPRSQLHAHNIIPQRSSTYPTEAFLPGQIDLRAPVERAVERVQAHIAALTERVEMLEAITGRRQIPTLSSSTLLPLGSSRSFLGGPLGPGRIWDPSQMGLWSFVISPLARIVESLQVLTLFIAYVPVEDEHHHIRDPRYRFSARGRRLSISTPVLLVVRRLLLDASFILTVFGMAGWVWRKTGLRRREVYAALGVLWRALLGSDAAPHSGKRMVDKGV
ncbi:acyl CoA binding protein-domain-containing protein [Gautieria morchelliformis]|nr:acyl CoA binding protein-domain-containing protein [Gautieria morchelliformis]